MVKNVKPQEPREMVRVRVKRAVNIGGVRYAPETDGKKTIPVEAVIPRERAAAHGPDDVEIIGDAAGGGRGE